MEVAGWMRRQQMTSTAIAAAAMVSFATLLVPWTREGTVERSAFALGRALNETGLVTTIAERCLYDALVVVPALVGLVCAATLLRRAGLAATLASVVGAIEVLASLAVLVEVRGSVEIAPWLSVVVGGITAASWPLWRMTRERGHV